jgi:glyoxylase-like metal-dependent hydrolase (beta-lactamase superfamily II)
VNANIGAVMKRILSLAFVLFLGGGVAQTALAQVPEPLNLVKRAVDAMGGVDALRRAKRFAITGEARHWEPEESFVAGGEPRFVDHSTFAIAWDVEKGLARTDWDRAIQFPSVTHDKYSEIVTPALGYVDFVSTTLNIVQADLPEKGKRAMSGIRLAAHLRELERASPTLLLKAIETPRNLSPVPDQTLGGGVFEGAFGGVFPAASLPAVAFTDGGTKFTILFDRKTFLPAAVRTLDDDNIHGDSNYDLILADWRPAGGVLVARSLIYTLDNIEIAKIAYKNVVANPLIPAETFTIPSEIKAAAKPPATGSVPYQWVLRRLNIGRFPDSDAVNFMPGESLKLVELSPNVQQVVGGSHNGLIVSMKGYVVVFDAPINEWQSRFTIDSAKAKYPGKQLKYMVLTHAHMDHAGGARTYVAEGATVIVPSPDKAFFEKVFKAAHTVNPDELQKNPKPATIVEVADRMSLKDDGGEIRLYRIPNPHVEAMLIGYVVNDDLVWVTDVYSPVRDKVKSPAGVAFYKTLKMLGLRPVRFAGGHGGAGSYADFDTIER